MYKMFLDDLRDPKVPGYVICRTSQEAIQCVLEKGIPEFILFDHDLGGGDTAMIFVQTIYNLGYPLSFDYHIHSDNCIGKKELISYIESWKRAQLL